MIITAFTLPVLDIKVNKLEFYFSELNHKVFRKVSQHLDVIRDWRGFGRALGIDEVSLQEIEYAYSLAGECVHLICEEILEYITGLLLRCRTVDRTFYARGNYRLLYIFPIADLLHILSL